jgi:hypothetical protein
VRGRCRKRKTLTPTLSRREREQYDEEAGLTAAGYRITKTEVTDLGYRRQNEDRGH